MVYYIFLDEKLWRNNSSLAIICQGCGIFNYISRVMSSPSIAVYNNNCTFYTRI